MDSNARLFAKAKADLAEDMQARGIGAIIWDNSQAGFHFIPSVMLSDGSTVVIEGMYLYNGEVYLMVEGSNPVSIDNLYDPDTETRPVVVTLDANDAARIIADPTGSKGFTREGTMKEWLAVTDCYYEALNEN